MIRTGLNWLNFVRAAGLTALIVKPNSEELTQLSKREERGNRGKNKIERTDYYTA